MDTYGIAELIRYNTNILNALIERFFNQIVGCQYLTLGGLQTTSPGLIAFLLPSPVLIRFNEELSVSDQVVAYVTLCVL